MDLFRKPLSLLLVIGACCAYPAHAEFKGVLNSPALATRLAAHRPLNAVVAIGSRLVAVGQRGHIVYSDDNASSWKQAEVPVRSDLTAVFFSSERFGWAVGHDGVVLHTADGGQTWKLQLDGIKAAALMRDYYVGKAKSGDAAAQSLLSEIEQYSAAGADKPFLDVWFESDRTGFVVGAFNLIFRTRDGGESWEPWFDRIDNPQRLHLYSIRGKGGRVFVAGEQGFVAGLGPAGNRFEAIQSTYSGSFFGVLPVEGGAILFGMRGNAFRMDAAGTGWQKLETGVVGGLAGAADLGEDRVALVSTAGDVLVGNVSSGQFERLKTLRATALAGVALIRSTNALALVGSNGASFASLPQQ